MQMKLREMPEVTGDFIIVDSFLGSACSPVRFYETYEEFLPHKEPSAATPQPKRVLAESWAAKSFFRCGAFAPMVLLSMIAASLPRIRGASFNFVSGLSKNCSCLGVDGNRFTKENLPEKQGIGG